MLSPARPCWRCRKPARELPPPSLHYCQLATTHPPVTPWDLVFAVLQFGFTLSATSVPAQMVQRGLIEPVLGACFTSLAANTNCRRINSTQQAEYVMMGAAPMPPDVDRFRVQV
jgi:hypothetical protein